jgi:uncharacterized protein YlzI (FlbEa/FlbD family)
MTNRDKAIEDFLNKTVIKDVSEDGAEETVCDLVTGECYIIRSKDGLIERVTNEKKYITEDGRQLLQD